MPDECTCHFVVKSWLRPCTHYFARLIFSSVTHARQTPNLYFLNIKNKHLSHDNTSNRRKKKSSIEIKTKAFYGMEKILSLVLLFL